MTFLMRSVAPLRQLSRAASQSTAAFSTSSARAALSENDIDAHKDTADRHAKIEHHKQDSIKKAKQGDAEWKPELASNSEQIRQHDKNEMSMDEMTKLGERKAQEGKTPSGSSSSDKH